MKTLEELKLDYAKKEGFETWDAWSKHKPARYISWSMGEVAKIYVHEALLEYSDYAQERMWVNQDADLSDFVEDFMKELLK